MPSLAGISLHPVQLSVPSAYTVSLSLYFSTKIRVVIFFLYSIHSSPTSCHIIWGRKLLCILF
jgi:hypothetical protein